MDAALRQRLTRMLPCPARERVPLAALTTFRIGGPAQILAEPRTIADLMGAAHVIRNEGVPCFWMGLGSNLLIADAGYDGIVVRGQGELCAIGSRGDIVFAGPGARLLDLTCYTAARGSTGMEALSGIPGSVGGGLYMNAGAYGAEISDTLIEVDVLTADLRREMLIKEEIGFGYRRASALQEVLVLESRYRLRSGDPRAIYSAMRYVWKQRRAKQPLEYPSAGSVFKRPPGDFAGRLVEEVGGKGERIGGAMVSPKHAGFIVNSGGATASDVTALVRLIRRRVYERFHVLLEMEIEPVGFEDDPFAIEI
jgi:UDP-N-acetylmuramate dehydrogenase